MNTIHETFCDGVFTGYLELDCTGHEVARYDRLDDEAIVHIQRGWLRFSGEPVEVEA